MIKVESFLYINKKLIPIKKFNGKLQDSFYIYGAIKLDINNHPIITLEMTDLVNNLWPYIINGITDIEEGKDEYFTNFPERLISFSFKISEDKKIISVNFDGNKASVDYKEFVQAIVYHFKDFFKELYRIEQSPSEIYEPYIDDVAYLENKYGKYNLNS